MAKLLDELLATQEAYYTSLKKTGEAAMKEAFKEVFDKHPSIESIYWTQYTPYFNDGDPCYFRMGEYEVEYLEDEEDEAIKNDDQNKVIDDINAIFDAGDDIFEAIFGDHKRITVTREGIAVRRHDHD